MQARSGSTCNGPRQSSGRYWTIGSAVGAWDREKEPTEWLSLSGRRTSNLPRLSCCKWPRREPSTGQHLHRSASEAARFRRMLKMETERVESKKTPDSPEIAQKTPEEEPLVEASNNSRWRAIFP